MATATRAAMPEGEPGAEVHDTRTRVADTRGRCGAVADIPSASVLRRRYPTYTSSDFDEVSKSYPQMRS